MELIHKNMSDSDVILFLKNGITTRRLLSITGDKNCVKRAFELGAKIDSFRKEMMVVMLECLRFNRYE